MTFKVSPRLSYCGSWILVGTYMYCFLIVFLPWRVAFVETAAHFSTWAILAWFAIPLIQRTPLRLHWQSWLFHLTLGIVFTLADIYIAHSIVPLITWHSEYQSLGDFFVTVFKSCFQLGLMTYFSLVVLIQGRDALHLAQMRKLQIEEHKAAFVQAQLQSLKTQLQPHFLFNTLHSIAALMHYDLTTADRMLNRLSELLRISLQETGNPIVSLKQEILFIEAYLDIEKIRFEERLRVLWAVPENLHGSAVPPFILQPLVENAIKYGISPRAAGGNIVIRAYVDNENLVMEVEDDAPDMLLQKKGFGIGLSNTRSRLETLYGNTQKFELIRANTGTIARILLPLSAQRPR